MVIVNAVPAVWVPMFPPPEAVTVKWSRAPVLTVNALLVPVCPLPSFAVMVTDDADLVNVTEPDQTPLLQPEVPVLVGLIVPDPVEADKPTELL